MPDSLIHAWISRRTAGVTAVAAAWFSIVLMCEFAFARLVRSTPGGVDREPECLLVLVACGVLGSFLAAALFDAKAGTQGLTTYFRICFLTTLASVVLPMQHSAYLVAALMGLGMGGLAATLFSRLRSAVGRARLGWHIGMGVGLAHAACALPWISQAPPTVQAVLVCVAAIMGSLVSGKLQVKFTGASNSSDYEVRIVKTWVLALVILTLMTSACFAIIQRMELPAVASWKQGVVPWVNVAVSFFVAAVAGRMLDKGNRVSLMFGAFGLLAFAGAGLGFVDNLGSLPLIVYSAGAPIVWICLMYYAARGGRPWQVAVVFSIAGWMASAVGASATSGLPGLSVPVILVAGLTLSVALGWRWHKVGRFRRAGMVAVLLALSFGKFLLPVPSAADYLYLSTLLPASRCGTFCPSAGSHPSLCHVIRDKAAFPVSNPTP
ncbi:MAG: hypothetical protein WC378_13685 [Opitutaceae bacterium]|jgi:hypothetical protein